METFHFNSNPNGGQPPVPVPEKTWALVGVLASGNLEILVEPAAATEEAPRCSVEVQTSAVGFGDVWRAVVEDFFGRHAAKSVGLRLTIHDAGATPAVVSLRLDQAVREFRAPLSSN